MKKWGEEGKGEESGKQHVLAGVEGSKQEDGDKQIGRYG